MYSEILKIYCSYESVTLMSAQFLEERRALDTGNERFAKNP